MTPLREIRHLATRFVGVLGSTPLGPQDQDQVNAALSAEQAAMFWEQDPIDQRHAFDVAQQVRARLGDNSSAIVAALLHDVGKRHSDVGAVGRSLATVLDAAHLPMSANWRRYREHEALGAADLEALGAEPLTVAFARGKADDVAAIDPAVWDALVAADNV